MRNAALAVLGIVAALTPAPGEPARDREPPPGPPKRVVGYFVEWGVYQRNYHVKDVPADRLTHLNYAFAKIADGECALYDAFAAVDKAYPGDKWDQGALRGSFNQLRQLKKKHPHLKTLISVGGWTLSGPFSDVALTAESRAKFARSCVRFLLKYGFDGIDIDWEYPCGGGLPGNRTRPEDKQNYTRLLAALRRELDAQEKADGRHYLLTIAAPAGPANIANLEPAGIAAQVDWINLMTYDFHGAWEFVTNFNAPLFAAAGDPSPDEAVRRRCNVDAAVQAYLKAGVPADRLVVGVPFYGRGWGGVGKGNNGLYQKAAPNPPRGTWEAGVFDYKDLAANYLPKHRRHWHAEAQVPWLYDPDGGLFISYDDPESLRLKARYVRDHHLGGVMFWELSADDGQSSLLGALHDGLKK
jgi:chitinase